MQHLLKAISALLLFSVCSCGSKTTNPVVPAMDSTLDHSFFPVTQYLKGQLIQLDSMPVTPLKITTINDHEDSAWLKKENIREFAEPFLHPEIDSSYLDMNYDKKSFLDQTINSVTLTFDAKNSQAQPKTIAVYINPQTNKVTRIYMVKEAAKNGGKETLQLTWDSEHFCKITTITEKEGSKPVIKDEKLLWDFSE